MSTTPSTSPDKMSPSVSAGSTPQKTPHRRQRMRTISTDAGESVRILREYIGDDMDEFLQARGLVKKNVPPDGSSIYRAVCEQISGVQTDHEGLRRLVELLLYASYQRLRAQQASSPVKSVVSSSDAPVVRLALRVDRDKDAFELLAKLTGYRIVIYRSPTEEVVYETAEEDASPERQITFCATTSPSIFEPVYTEKMHEALAISQAIVYRVLYENVFGNSAKVINEAIEMIRKDTEESNLMTTVPCDQSAVSKSEGREKANGVKRKRVPFPFSACKSLDPSIYRNVEFDIHREKRKQEKTMQELAERNSLLVKFGPGTLCMARDGGRVKTARVMENVDLSTRLIKFEDGSGMRHMAVSDLRPLLQPTKGSQQIRGGNGGEDGGGKARLRLYSLSAQNNDSMAIPPPPISSASFSGVGEQGVHQPQYRPALLPTPYSLPPPYPAPPPPFQSGYGVPGLIASLSDTNGGNGTRTTAGGGGGGTLQPQPLMSTLLSPPPQGFPASHQTTLTPGMPTTPGYYMARGGEAASPIFNFDFLHSPLPQLNPPLAYASSPMLNPQSTYQAGGKGGGDQQQKNQPAGGGGETKATPSRSHCGGKRDGEETKKVHSTKVENSNSGKCILSLRFSSSSSNNNSVASGAESGTPRITPHNSLRDTPKRPRTKREGSEKKEERQDADQADCLVYEQITVPFISPSDMAMMNLDGAGFSSDSLGRDLPDVLTTRFFFNLGVNFYRSRLTAQGTQVTASPLISLNNGSDGGGRGPPITPHILPPSPGLIPVPSFEGQHMPQSPGMPIPVMSPILFDSSAGHEVMMGMVVSPGIHNVPPHLLQYMLPNIEGMPGYSLMSSGAFGASGPYPGWTTVAPDGNIFFPAEFQVPSE